MIKQTILALASLATISIAAFPMTTGTALAQSIRCTVGTQCDPGGGGGGNGGGSSYNCSGHLGYLARVYEEDLEVIDNPNNVSIMTVCEGEGFGGFRNDGNAGALRLVIADNEAMMEALFRKNFGSDDVVGVRLIGDEKVILYVSPFHHYY